MLDLIDLARHQGLEAPTRMVLEAAVRKGGPQSARVGLAELARISGDPWSMPDERTVRDERIRFHSAIADVVSGLAEGRPSRLGSRAAALSPLLRESGQEPAEVQEQRIREVEAPVRP